MAAGSENGQFWSRDCPCRRDDKALRVCWCKQSRGGDEDFVVPTNHAIVGAVIAARPLVDKRPSLGLSRTVSASLRLKT